MQPFSLYKLPIITDSWATTESVKPKQKAQQQSATTISGALTKKSAAPTLQPVAARTAASPRPAATKSRKPTTPKSSN